MPHGIGVDAGSDSKALECFRKGAEKGFPRAQFLLGEAYSARPEEWSRATRRPPRWYQSAAWLGYPAAQTELGRCLEFGTGLPQSIEQAVKWYRAAAENGNAPGQCCLGFLYESGQGVEQNWEEAVRWYRAAAEQDYPRALCNLAWCYEHGKGVEQDYPEAARLYLRAAEQDYPRGQLCMGFCCERGRGVPLDPSRLPRIGTGRRPSRRTRTPSAAWGFCTRAARGWSRAGRRRCGGTVPRAEQGLPRAQCNLAWCYEYGKGVRPGFGRELPSGTGKRPSRGMPEDFSAWPAALTMAAV